MRFVRTNFAFHMLSIFPFEILIFLFSMNMSCNYRSSFLPEAYFYLCEF